MSASLTMPVAARQHEARVHQIVAYLWLRGLLGGLCWGGLDSNGLGEGNDMASCAADNFICGERKALTVVQVLLSD